MTTPQTAAGRALLDDSTVGEQDRVRFDAPRLWLTDRILAIEAEARAALLADLRAKVADERLVVLRKPRTTPGPEGDYIARLLDRAAVLRLIDEAGRDNAPEKPNG